MTLTWFDVFVATSGRMAPLEGAFLHALAYAAARWTSAGHMVELGSYRGRSACAIGSACKETGQKLTCVDNWSQTNNTKDNSMAIFVKNISDAGLEDVVDMVEGDSAEIGKKWIREALSMLFIDAAHDKASVRDDVNAWIGHVQPRGIIAFHDSQSIGVEPIIKETVEAHKLIPVGIAGSVTAFQKL